MRSLNGYYCRHHTAVVSPYFFSSSHRSSRLLLHFLRQPLSMLCSVEALDIELFHNRLNPLAFNITKNISTLFGRRDHLLFWFFFSFFNIFFLLFFLFVSHKRISLSVLSAPGYSTHCRILALFWFFARFFFSIILFSEQLILPFQLFTLRLWVDSC